MMDGKAGFFYHSLATSRIQVIPSSLDGDSSRLPSDAGRAHPRPWLRAHGRAGPPSRPDTGDVSVSGLAGMRPSSLDVAPSRLPSDAGRAHPRPWLRAHGRAGPPSRPDTGDVSVSGLAGMSSLLKGKSGRNARAPREDTNGSAGGGRFQCSGRRDSGWQGADTVGGGLPAV